MPIILSQRIDLVSDYKDKPFFRYHFPKRYRNQIKTGDVFVYYQGDSKKLANRCYFGCGVIGEITLDKKDDGSLNAEIRFGVQFPRRVPIHFDSNDGRYYESLGFRSVRKMPNPSWQNSIRKLTVPAFEKILLDSGLTVHANFNDWIA
jgi:hypothetical protein